MVPIHPCLVRILPGSLFSRVNATMLLANDDPGKVFSQTAGPIRTSVRDEGNACLTLLV